MKEQCCNQKSHHSNEIPLDHTKAVNDRYGAAAIEKEACLCSPVDFDTKLLEIIPREVIERDYGCGDPTRWVRLGDKVLDLGSGSGKNSFICAQVVGESGGVIGVDRNSKMLALSRKAAPIVASNMGYSNVSFVEGEIESLDKQIGDGSPLISDSSVDIVLSNCVLNLVNPSRRQQLLGNIRRVLKPCGRVAISDIVSNKFVPASLQKDPELWSGCISGAWQEDAFIEAFRGLGFVEVMFSERSEKPWKVIDGIEFRSVTLVGHL